QIRSPSGETVTCAVPCGRSVTCRWLSVALSHAYTSNTPLALETYTLWSSASRAQCGSVIRAAVNRARQRCSRSGSSTRVRGVLTWVTGKSCHWPGPRRIVPAPDRHPRYGTTTRSSRAFPDSTSLRRPAPSRTSGADLGALSRQQPPAARLADVHV